MEFDPKSARIIAEETRKAKRKPRSLVGAYRSPIILTPNKIIKLTEALQPFSGTTPGKGKGLLQLFDGDAIKNLGQEVKVYNLTESTIKVGSYVLCNICDGFYFYTVTLCSNGS